MIKDNRNKIILGLIILLAAFLRLFRLTRPDMLTDAAHYSFRAIGYLDYLSPNTQTTPIVWFNFRPWWSFLSFHDHPPLVFMIQNFFFKIFGVSTFSAILPFALFGIGSVILVYFLTKKLYGHKCAYVAVFLLAICNYHVWISRVGYLESILIFFVLLSVYYFLRALEKEKYFIHFGLLLGLSFLCKYTAFALIPVFFFYLLFQKREVFQRRKFWIGLLLCLIVFSPALIYNLKMYQTRGHFDMQFASLFKQDMSDWPNIQRSVSTDFSEQLLSVWNSLQNSFSPIIFYLFFISLGFILFQCIFQKNNRKKHYLIILLLVFLTLFFILTKAGSYFSSVYAPFVIIVISYFLVKCIDFFKDKQKYILICLLCLPAIYIIFFTVNTNLLYQAKGEEGKMYAKIRLENFGFNQLEEFLNNKIKIKDRSLNEINTYKDLFLINSKGTLETNPEVLSVFIFDENLNWFARMWHFRRRIVYQKVVFISTQEFLSLNQDLSDSLRERYENFYFIRGVNEETFDSAKYRTPFAESFEKLLVEQFNLSPVIIKNPKGETAFKIYEFK